MNATPDRRGRRRKRRKRNRIFKIKKSMVVVPEFYKVGLCIFKNPKLKMDSFERIPTIFWSQIIIVITICYGMKIVGYKFQVTASF